MKTNKLTVLASAKTWIEGESLRQLERVLSLKGMLKVVGFPDLHPGKGYPIGAAMLSEGEFYPYLIGSDIGCGMSLFATDLAVAKAKPEKWSRKVKCPDTSWDGDLEQWLEERGLQPELIHSLGTIGHGNHFVELLRMDQIHNGEAFSELGYEEENLFLLVHSGSRGIGDMLLREHIAQFRDGSLKAGSHEAVSYLGQHDLALKWARANRELVASRVLQQLNSGHRLLVDLSHNSLTQLNDENGGRFLHRKGAAPSDNGAMVIPGSRGTQSYLVIPSGEQKDNLWSVAHGAGRKWKRSECKDRLRDRYPAKSLIKTKLGSYVVCEDKELLYEEAPQAYKDITTVINDMVSFGLIQVIASFSPILTLKGGNRE